MNTHWNCLYEAIPMGIQKIYRFSKLNRSLQITIPVSVSTPKSIIHDYTQYAVLYDDIPR